eukprot:6213491-Pleurochrysis_carterae.AAC.2
MDCSMPLEPKELARLQREAGKTPPELLCFRSIREEPRELPPLFKLAGCKLLLLPWWSVLRFRSTSELMRRLNVPGNWPSELTELPRLFSARSEEEPELPRRCRRTLAPAELARRFRRTGGIRPTPLGWLGGSTGEAHRCQSYLAAAARRQHPRSFRDDSGGLEEFGLSRPGSRYLAIRQPRSSSAGRTQVGVAPQAARHQLPSATWLVSSCGVHVHLRAHAAIESSRQLAIRTK